MPGRSSEPPRDDRERTAEIRTHARAYCKCIWCDRPEEASYHLAELERLERQQP